jgi:hypothetical protein
MFLWLAEAAEAAALVIQHVEVLVVAVLAACAM